MFARQSLNCKNIVVMLGQRERESLLVWNSSCCGPLALHQHDGICHWVITEYEVVCKRIASVGTDEFFIPFLSAVSSITFELMNFHVCKCVNLAFLPYPNQQRS